MSSRDSKSCQQESGFYPREFARANVQLYTYRFLAVATRWPQLAI